MASDSRLRYSGNLLPVEVILQIQLTGKVIMLVHRIDIMIKHIDRGLHGMMIQVRLIMLIQFVIQVIHIYWAFVICLAMYGSGYMNMMVQVFWQWEVPGIIIQDVD